MTPRPPSTHPTRSLTRAQIRLCPGYLRQKSRSTPPPQDRLLHHPHRGAAIPVLLYRPRQHRYISTIPYPCTMKIDDRAGNARLAGLEEDLHMDPESYDYSTVLSVFYVSYIIFEIPCSLLNKWIGPGWFIPATTLGFGICSLGTGFVSEYRHGKRLRRLELMVDRY